MADSNGIDRTRRKARLGGSGFTIYYWGTEPLVFARMVSDQSPTAIGPGTVPIHPLDAKYPVELMTPQATTMGQLELEFYDYYGARFWDRLPSLKDATDLVEVFERVAQHGEVTISKFIKDPHIANARTSSLGSVSQYYYHNCVVSQLLDGEQIEVGTMEVLKRIIVNYTHVSRTESG